jgi:hypothetical protein
MKNPSIYLWKLISFEQKYGYNLLYIIFDNNFAMWALYSPKIYKKIRTYLKVFLYLASTHSKPILIPLLYHTHGEKLKNV